MKKLFLIPLAFYAGVGMGDFVEGPSSSDIFWGKHYLNNVFFAYILNSIDQKDLIDTAKSILSENFKNDTDCFSEALDEFGNNIIKYNKDTYNKLLELIH